MVIYIQRFGITIADVTLFLSLYVFTGIGITGGYHRYYSHRAYECVRFFQYVLLFAGTMALQSPLLDWASDHRYHHRHVDGEADPYSINRGFFYAHMGWIFYDDLGKDGQGRPLDNIRDLKKDPLLVFQRKYFWPIGIALGFGIPTLIGALYGRPFGGFLWGGMLRILWTHHCIFLINSASHTFGKRPHSEKHSARDSGLIALISFGEGYHNFHHTFASDYRNGHAWHHWDPTKWMIRCAYFLGLATEIRTTAPATIAQSRNFGLRHDSGKSPESDDFSRTLTGP